MRRALLPRLSPGVEPNVPKGRAASRLGSVLHTIGVKSGRVHRRLAPGACQLRLLFQEAFQSGLYNHAPAFTFFRGVFLQLLDQLRA